MQKSLTTSEIRDWTLKIIAEFEKLRITVFTEPKLRLIGRKLLESAGLTDDEIIYPIEQIVDYMLGYGILSKLMNDETVTEIMVNGTRSIFIERQGKLEKYSGNFESDADIMRIINKMVAKIGKRIDTSSPLVDGRLLDGSRFNAIVSPLSMIGPVLTIRKFPKTQPKLDWLVQNRTVSSELAKFLRSAVFKKLNILISGGTGSGKTTTLNVLAGLVGLGERLITLEDAAELKINHPHLITLEARTANLEGHGEITLRHLLRNALRMRPDRIILGEVRGIEAVDMLQAMNTGHPGSLSSIHANSSLESLHRLETMALMADVAIPLNALRLQVRSAIDLIIQQERLDNGQRIVTEVNLVNKYSKTELNDYYLTPVFTWNDAKGEYETRSMKNLDTSLFNKRMHKLIKEYEISDSDVGHI